MAHERKIPSNQTFAHHLTELRNRILTCIVSLLTGSILGYAFYDKIELALVKPLNDTLYYSTPGGGFNFMIQVCILVGVIASVPILVYNLLRFLEPALPGKRSMNSFVVFLSSLVLLITGISFAYYISLPAALNFLNGFSSETVKALITTGDYLSFSGFYIGGFAAIFQLPLILLFINHIKPLDPGSLMRSTPYVVLLAFVMAAVLTPTTDPINQLIMAGPIIGLYLLSAVLVWFKNKSYKKPRAVLVPTLAPAPVQPIKPKAQPPQTRQPAEAPRRIPIMQPFMPDTQFVKKQPRLIQL